MISSFSGNGRELPQDLHFVLNWLDDSSLHAMNQTSKSWRSFIGRMEILIDRCIIQFGKEKFENVDSLILLSYSDKMKTVAASMIHYNINLGQMGESPEDDKKWLACTPFIDALMQRMFEIPKKRIFRINKELERQRDYPDAKEIASKPTIVDVEPILLANLDIQALVTMSKTSKYWRAAVAPTLGHLILNGIILKTQNPKLFSTKQTLAIEDLEAKRRIFFELYMSDSLIKSAGEYGKSQLFKNLVVDYRVLQGVARGREERTKLCEAAQPQLPEVDNVASIHEPLPSLRDLWNLNISSLYPSVTITFSNRELLPDIQDTLINNYLDYAALCAMKRTSREWQRFVTQLEHRFLNRFVQTKNSDAFVGYETSIISLSSLEDKRNAIIECKVNDSLYKGIMDRSTIKEMEGSPFFEGFVGWCMKLQASQQIPIAKTSWKPSWLSSAVSVVETPPLVSVPVVEAAALSEKIAPPEDNTELPEPAQTEFSVINSQLSGTDQVVPIQEIEKLSLKDLWNLHINSLYPSS